ncbi:hypothetical protein NDU88_005892 [Pleurodeles waltl]|uniref:Uncharacterized protein n=1 Tax=Pleurodeles waltl TaxID=8319 RepID=A0AAV7MXQ5_PLEWA|nr:hypothetical protein NDU88_005892 [Pleurodeles waltl]
MGPSSMQTMHLLLWTTLTLCFHTAKTTPIKKEILLTATATAVIKPVLRPELTLLSKTDIPLKQELAWMPQKEPLLHPPTLRVQKVEVPQPRQLVSVAIHDCVDQGDDDEPEEEEILQDQGTTADDD